MGRIVGLLTVAAIVAIILPIPGNHFATNGSGALVPLSFVLGALVAMPVARASSRWPVRRLLLGVVAQIRAWKVVQSERVIKGTRRAMAKVWDHTAASTDREIALVSWIFTTFVATSLLSWLVLSINLARRTEVPPARCTVSDFSPSSPGGPFTAKIHCPLPGGGQLTERSRFGANRWPILAPPGVMYGKLYRAGVAGWLVDLDSAQFRGDAEDAERRSQNAVAANSTAPADTAGDDPENSWIAIGENNQAVLRQRGLSPGRCEVTCTKVPGEPPAWISSRCIGKRIDLRFVSNDCQRAVVLHQLPTGTFDFPSAIVADVYDRGSLAYPVVAGAVVKDWSKVRTAGNTFYWLAGELGVPGPPPRYQSSTQAIEFQTIDGRRQAIPLVSAPPPPVPGGSAPVASSAPAPRASTSAVRSPANRPGKHAKRRRH